MTVGGVKSLAFGNQTELIIKNDLIDSIFILTTGEEILGEEITSSTGSGVIVPPNLDIDLSANLIVSLIQLKLNNQNSTQFEILDFGMHQI